MSDSITYRKTIRQRFDATAFHQTGVLDATTSVSKIKLDIVAKKVTIQPAVGVTVTVDVSLDGVRWTQIVTGLTAMLSYGDTVGDYLVKHVRVTRTAGSGNVVIVGA